MKILGLHYENGAVADYRIWMPFKAMNALKIAECKHPPDDVQTNPIPLDRTAPEYSSERGSYQDLGEWAELLVAQRMSHLRTLALVLGLRAAYGTPLIAECDDNLMWVPPSNTSYAAYRIKAPGEDVRYIPIQPKDLPLYRNRQDGIVLFSQHGHAVFATLAGEPKGRQVSMDFLKEADAVTTTTKYLAEEFKELNPFVYVLPNCIETERWDKIRPVPHRGVRIAWFGGMQHYEDVKLVKDVVPRILDENPDVTLVLPSAVFDFWEHLIRDSSQIEIVDYAPIQQWPEYLGSQNVDIALAPLVDDRFNRCKSNLKLLEYGALGVPCVFSKSNAYEEVVHGETGMVAETENDWYESLSALIRSEKLRLSVGLKAKQFVFDRYDIRKNAPRWLECYEDVVRRSGKMRKRESERLSREVREQDIPPDSGLGLSWGARA